jgi:carbamoyltransferase
MGLAPYGEPRYADLIRDNLIEIYDDGSFWMDMDYFDYCHGLTMTSSKFHQLFGGPPRQPESLLTQREMDLAASVQVVTEDIMLSSARHLHKQTGMSNLCLAGGVALNCVGNGRILREGPFERLWIQPAAGDAGGALGAAFFVWHQLLDRPRSPRSTDGMRGSLLGPSFTDEEIRERLEAKGATFRWFDDLTECWEHVAELLANEQVVGWLQGRLEFGPRALGARSILGDARSPRLQSVMNQKIKFRESFRPFAPIVLKEDAADFFDVRRGTESPYMLLVAAVRHDQRLATTTTTDGPALQDLHVERSTIPAVTHVDYSARLQTVDAERSGPIYDLLAAFKRKTGCGVLINTSFNVRGEPIVCTPDEAYQCFMATNMDALVMGRCVLSKTVQTHPADHPTDDYLARFPLD